MPDLLADTHAFVWHVIEPARLGKGARRAFTASDAGRSTCHISAISLVEIALLHEKGRLRLGAAQMLDAIAGHPGYAVLPIDLEQAIEFGALPAIRDPMDRMIVAAARATGSRLISADQALRGHGVDIVWD